MTGTQDDQPESKCESIAGTQDRAARAVGHRVLIGIATFNERENLPSLLDSIFHAIPACDVLVVDDDSPDGTGAWCEQRAAQEIRLKCLHRGGKLGLGTAAIECVRYAIENEYEFLINLDADHSHDPQVIPTMLQIVRDPQADVDVVVGSRYVPGGCIQGWPIWRRCASRLVNTLARWGLGIPVRDCSGSFRCYRVEALRRIELSQLISTGYSIYEELLAVLHRHGAAMFETPIVFSDRVVGETKVDLKEMVRSAWQLLKLAWHDTAKK